MTDPRDAPLMDNSPTEAPSVTSDIAKAPSPPQQRPRKAKLMADRERLGRQWLEDLGMGLNHELRNHLCVLDGALQILKSQAEESTTGSKPVAFAEQATQHILDILEELGSLTKNPDLRIRPLQLNTFVEARWPALRRQAELMGILAIRRLDGRLPWVRGDVKSVTEAFDEVVKNALEAMPHGGRLGVETTWDAQEKAVILCVRDSGPGLPVDSLRKSPLPFFSTKRDCLGLGLAKAKRILELHQGLLRLDSAPQIGTCVSFVFPSAEAPDEPFR